MTEVRSRWRLILLSFLSLLAGSVALVAYLRRPACTTGSDCTGTALLLAIPLTLLFALFLTWAASQNDKRRRAGLRRIIDQVSQGELPTVTDLSYDDETGRLAGNLGYLLGQTRSQIQQLEHDRERLYNVLDNMTDGVLFTDERGQVAFINPVGAHQLDISVSRAGGRSFAEVARHHQLIDLWQQCRERGTEQTSMIEMTRRDLFLQATISPLGAAAKQGYLIILHDLTRVRRADMARRDLISNVSHEFRTPLASLRALAETLRDGALEDPPAARRFLARAEMEVDTLTQIVEELLTLSRIESGRVPLRLQPTNAVDLILKPAERLLPQAERKEIALVLDLPGGLPDVLADADQFAQVVSNLVHNAIKFTPTGGRITLSAAVHGEDVHFSVADNGEGIPSEYLPRIFERFYKADRVRQRGRGGTGLGLAIAKHTVQSHGGEIWAKSKEGKGSTFYFSLPVAR